jgi:ABC-type dipeptide/oligopeptide/nickel transport system permease component
MQARAGRSLPAVQADQATFIASRARMSDSQIVAEVIFDFPGIGELALTALNARDYPLIQGITIVTATTFVIVNLLIDLLYARIDPRIRLEQP